MVKIILVSHGKYAKAMLESAQLIVGEQEDVTAFEFNLGDSVDQLQESVSKEINKTKDKGEILVLTDMFSGSPFNAVSALMEENSIYHITGINLPILLEILTMRNDTSAEEICNSVMEKGKDTIIYVNKFIEGME